MVFGTISIILLAIGFVLLLLGILKAVKASQAVAVVGIIFLAVGLLGGMGFINFGGVIPTSQPFTAGQFEAPITEETPICSANAITSNGLSRADILIRNIENASLGYLTGTVTANSNGAFIDSVTANAGSSASYAAMTAIPNCAVGELVITLTTGTGVASSRRVKDVETSTIVSGYNFNDRAVHKYELLSASTDVVNILARSSALAASSNGQTNGTIEVTYAVSGTGTADGTAYYTNTSLAARGTLNFYIDAQTNGTSTVTGQFDEPDGVVISYDTGTASVFSTSSLTLQSDTAGWALTPFIKGGKHSCPDDITNNRNSEVCWTAPTMKGGTLYRLKGTVTSDLADVAAGNTHPLVCIDDRVSFRDTDGNVKYQSFSTSGTNQGIGGTCLRFIFS